MKVWSLHINKLVFKVDGLIFKTLISMLNPFTPFSYSKPCLEQTWSVSGSLSIYRTCLESQGKQPAWRATTSPGSTTSVLPSPTHSLHSPWPGLPSKPPPTQSRRNPQGEDIGDILGMGLCKNENNLKHGNFLSLVI